MLASPWSRKHLQELNARSKSHFGVLQAVIFDCAANALFSP